MKTLLVIDMQGSFLNPNGGLYIGHDTKALIEFIETLAGDASYSTKVATLDTHKPDDCEFQQFPVHCVKDTDGWEMHLKLSEWMDIAYQKSSFSSHQLVQALVDKYLASPGDVLHVTGICTHICLRNIIMDIVNLVKEKYNRIPNITIMANGIDDFDPKAAETALHELQTLYGVKIDYRKS